MALVLAVPMPLEGTVPVLRLCVLIPVLLTCAELSSTMFAILLGESCWLDWWLVFPWLEVRLCIPAPGLLCDELSFVVFGEAWANLLLPLNILF